LVATDIAARGIDIDELPHVVNYEIPNVCEDYVHRIGRTGRAGNSGEAVNLVSLDEEGFMMAIESFTKQEIPVQIFDEFMPEPGERAEPIAMGRQTIWGGAGKPPSRDVMAAAAKAARTEMLTRVREKKASDGGSPGRGHGGGGQRQRSAPQGEGQGDNRGEGRGEGGGRGRNGGGGGRNAQGPRPARQGEGQGQGQPRNRDNFGGGNGGGGQPRNADRPNRGPREDRGDGGERGERQPGPNAHLGSLRIREPRNQGSSPGGQPDPLRTSIDSLGSRGGRGGNGGGGGNRGRGGPGGRSGGGGGGGKQGGGADPLRTSYGRIR
jgi:ATP-dependent RNA helicase RhlE